MGRAGRPRKPGKRYPSGGLKPRKRQDDRFVDDKVRACRQPHRRVLDEDDRLNVAAESPLGRLYIGGLLRDPANAGEDPQAAEARCIGGDLYAQIVGAYRSVIGTPRSSAGSALRNLVADDFNVAPTEEDQAPRGSGCASEHGEPIERVVMLAGKRLIVREWPCQRDPDGCACARRRERYMRAYEALAGATMVVDGRERPAGRRALMTVARVVVHREEIAAQDRVYLVAGLTALARHFGLTGHGRRGHSRNAD